VRIVLVAHHWPLESAGGTGLYVAALATALEALGHTVMRLAPGPSGPVGLSAAGRGAMLVSSPAPGRWEETWRRPEQDAVLRRWFAGWSPDVVHLHHLSGLSWGLVRAARATGARTVLTLHDYQIICARGQLVDRDLAPCRGPAPARCASCIREQLALDPGTAWIGRLLAPWPQLRSRLRRAAVPQVPRGGATRAADRLAAAHHVLAAVDVLLAPSIDLAERVESIGFRRPTWCPLPLTRAPVPMAQPGSGPLRLLFLGSLIPTKGVDLLVEAYSRLPEGVATLTLAGPAPSFDGQPGFAAALRGRCDKLKGVRLLGEVVGAEVDALWGSHDVLVLPSIWPENSPLVVREATAAGLVVVVGATGGARELAPAARPVATGDVAALTDALRAEVALGRRRMEPSEWQDPREHAEWLLSRAYRADGAP
jgi:glycosyltransferase involved in cell wall biosynthesis